MDFERINNALEVCEKHLDAGASGTEIETYLVGYVLVFAASEFEQRFRKMVHKRCCRHSDPPLEAFCPLPASRD